MNNSSTFVKITNEDIWNEIQDMKRSLGRMKTLERLVIAGFSVVGTILYYLAGKV